MCEPELVQMVYVCDAKVERGKEDGLRGGERGKEGERRDQGAKEDFFRYRALEIGSSAV